MASRYAWDSRFPWEVRNIAGVHVKTRMLIGRVETEGPDRLEALWNWLSSWIAPDGGLNGPVVHRGDLKRLVAIHDTPWTQSAVIDGLLHLYRRTGKDYWLRSAIRLGDAQCMRQESDGRFRWAGHEDDRFSSLVHNALADCSLLHLADVLRDRSDSVRRNRYLAAAERNLRQYVIGKLYRPRLSGFAMNPIDYYAHQDRFIINMNSVAVEALIKLDRQRETGRHLQLVLTVGERIRSLQSIDGPCKGGLPYSDLRIDEHISLYTGLSLRGLPGLAEVTGNPAWVEVARCVVKFLECMKDPDTLLWYHRVDSGGVDRFPIFVAGAGMICNGILDAAQLTGSAVDVNDLAARLLRFQYPHGPIRNFIGYDHPDNRRSRGSGVECWEDAYPTPNWNAQAFHFLCRVLPPPEPPRRPKGRRGGAWSRRYIYMETPRISAVVGMWPPGRSMAAFYVKPLRYGLVIPGPDVALRAAMRMIMKLTQGRTFMQWLLKWIARVRGRTVRRSEVTPRVR